MAKNVLILNGAYDYGFKGNRKFAFVTEADLGNADGKKAPASVLKRISQETKWQKFDAVIVQNNMDIGVEKAKAVDPSIRDKVIIVWNDEPNKSDILPYQKLGIEHFLGVHQLQKCLDELIKGGENG